MNRESNKEIDILLRKLGRKQNGNLAAESNSAASAEAHLDADELNAYAEQALPTTLRARYTEHLADCSRCRSIVTQLSLALPPVVSRDIVEQSTRLSWKTFLAGLFSPLVIRYTVPAMAVIMVFALAWIVLRRPAGNVDVATNAEKSSAPSVGVLSDSAPSPGAAPEASVVAQADAKREVQNKQANVPQEEGAPTSAAASKSADEVKEGEERARRDEPSPPTPTPAVATAVATGGVAPAPKPATPVDENKPADQKKVESDFARNQGPSELQRARAPKAVPSQPPKVESRDVTAGRTNESVRALSSERAARAETKQKDQARDDKAETRSVAGHRFTRRGKVWIDVLYDSDRSTVNVSRGSDQYRALVGDEPGLRTIAEQLGGEIIVVWKNRAYRIR